MPMNPRKKTKVTAQSASVLVETNAKAPVKKKVTFFDQRDDDEKAANAKLARCAARKFAKNRENPDGAVSSNDEEDSEGSGEESDCSFVSFTPPPPTPAKKTTKKTTKARVKVAPTQKPAYPPRSKKRKINFSDLDDEEETPEKGSSKPRAKPNSQPKENPGASKNKQTPKSQDKKKTEPIPRARRLQAVPLGSISQMDWMNREEPNISRGDGVAPPQEPLVKTIFARSESTLPRSNAVNNDLFDHFSLSVDVENGDAPKIPLNLRRKSETDVVQERLASIRLSSLQHQHREKPKKSGTSAGMGPCDHQDEVTDSEDSEGELRAKIKELEIEKPVWNLNRFQLRRFFATAFDARSGIRPSLACSRIAAYLQRIDRKLYNAELVTAEQDDSPTFRVFYENIPKYTSFDPYYTDPGVFTGAVMKWDKLGAFNPRFAVDGFGNFYIQILKIWVHFPSGFEKVKGTWKLVDLSDRSLGNPAKLLAIINEKPVCAYPWPTNTRTNSKGAKITDPNGAFKASILLLNGFIPVLDSPPYKEEADLLADNQKILGIQCDSDLIAENPTAAQKDAVYTRLENFVWRCVPSVFRADLFGAFDSDNGETLAQKQSRIVEDRFFKLQKIFDVLFGQKKPDHPGTTRLSPLDSAIKAVKEALPDIFIRNEEFWPKSLLIEALVYANSRQPFTESTAMMSLMGVSRGIPAKVIRWQYKWSEQENLSEADIMEQRSKHNQKELEKALKELLGIPNPTGLAHEQGSMEINSNKAECSRKDTNSTADISSPIDPLCVNSARRGLNRSTSKFPFFQTYPKDALTENPKVDSQLNSASE